jgi:hypothetical protein
MAGVPIVFRDQKQRILASYDYIDIADGTGVIKFYAEIAEDTNGKIYALSRTIQRTTVVEESGTMSGSTITKGFDKDFDLTAFNKPQVVDGKVTAGFSWEQYEAGGAISAEGYVRLVIKHVTAGGTETDLVTLQTPTASGGSDDIKVVDFISGTIPRTNFKIGDILRITYEGWWRQTGGTPQSSIENRFHFDPNNAANGLMDEGETQFFINIPFKIEI